MGSQDPVVEWKYLHRNASLSALGNDSAKVQALDFAKQALAQAQTSFGADDARVAQSRALVQRISGDLARIRKWQSLSQQARLFSERHGKNRTIADAKKAVFYAEQALAYAQETFGKNDAHVALSMESLEPLTTNLAVSYIIAKKPLEARAAYQRLITTEEEAFGTHDKRLVRHLIYLAQLEADSDVSAARAHYERAFDIGESAVSATSEYHLLGGLPGELDVLFRKLEALYAQSGSPQMTAGLAARETKIRATLKRLSDNKCFTNNCPGSECYQRPSGCVGSICTADVICAPLGYDPFHRRERRARIWSLAAGFLALIGLCVWWRFKRASPA